MKEQIKPPKKMQLRRDSESIRCTVQNIGDQDAHRIG